MSVLYEGDSIRCPKCNETEKIDSKIVHDAIVMRFYNFVCYSCGFKGFWYIEDNPSKRERWLAITLKIDTFPLSAKNHDRIIKWRDSRDGKEV